MVYRIFVEKKRGFDSEAQSLLADVKTFLGIKNLIDVRVVNRYDVENIDHELFDYACTAVFSEPQVDDTFIDPDFTGAMTFAVEYLPGQFDQRADSAAQCIQIISQKERPLVRTAKIYALYGDLTEKQIEAIKKYVINPVESREASFELPETLVSVYDVPDSVKTLEGFINYSDAELEKFLVRYGLAMDKDDLQFCRDYFRSEKRDPTITEIKMIDTYWSDHCRHTTFLTTIDQVSFEDAFLQKEYEEYLGMRKSLGRTKPVNLMDIATIAAKYLKKTGKLDKLDESEEINACTVKIEVDADGKKNLGCCYLKTKHTITPRK